MINRTIIRVKIVQLMYAYYQNGGKNLDSAEKELLFSMSKAYDLYNYLLLLMVEVTRYASEVVAKKEQLNKVAHKDENISHRFVDNLFIAQLDINKELNDYKEAQKKSWDSEHAYVKALYEDIVKSAYYEEYMAADATDYEADRTLWRRIYKHIIMPDTRIDDLLEGQSLYWNDDKEIVDTFVMKTIKHFKPENGAGQELVPEYRSEEDREFATRLFRRAILNDEDYRKIIAGTLRNWEMNRLAFMDIIILQIAVAEMLSFPLIPVSVTVNEYVEIAKLYSTPRSGNYINGVLYNLANQLIKEGKLAK